VDPNYKDDPAVLEGAEEETAPDDEADEETDRRPS
jgi:hypothetical protein